MRFSFNIYGLAKNRRKNSCHLPKYLLTSGNNRWADMIQPEFEHERVLGNTLNFYVGVGKPRPSVTGVILQPDGQDIPVPLDQQKVQCHPQNLLRKPEN